jgi:hypothetical protein
LYGGQSISSSTASANVCRLGALAFEVGDVANKGPDEGGLHGKDAAKALLDAFTEEQAFWEKYRDQRCTRVEEYDMYGGSGSGTGVLTCHIRLSLERLRELRQP